MILALVIAWLAYKKARDTGRSNPILWALAGAGVFIGTQLIVSLGLGMLLGFGSAIWGWSEDVLYNYDIPIRILAAVLSFITSWLLLRYLDRVPKQNSFSQPPPPPPKF